MHFTSYIPTGIIDCPWPPTKVSGSPSKRQSILPKLSRLAHRRSLRSCSHIGEETPLKNKGRRQNGASGRMCLWLSFIYYDESFFRSFVASSMPSCVKQSCCCWRKRKAASGVVIPTPLETPVPHETSYIMSKTAVHHRPKLLHPDIIA